MKMKIGDKAYPVDNSYSFTVGTKDNPYLAGTIAGIIFDWHNNTREVREVMEYTPAKLVTIVSNPYLIVNHWGEQTEVVTVMYNRKCHVVMNNFSHTKPE